MITFNTSNEECDTCKAPPGGQHRMRICYTTGAEIIEEIAARETAHANETMDAKEAALLEHGYGFGRKTDPASIVGLPDPTVASMEAANARSFEWHAIARALIGIVQRPEHEIDAMTLLQRVEWLIADHGRLRRLEIVMQGPPQTRADLDKAINNVRAMDREEIMRLRASIVEIVKQRDQSEQGERAAHGAIDAYRVVIADQATQIAELRAELTRTRDEAARTRTELMGAVEHAERLIGERNEERERRKTAEAKIADLDRVLDGRVAVLGGDVLSKLEAQIDMAWGLIANASGGDWTQQGPAWVKAAEKWRDDYSTRTMHVAPKADETSAAIRQQLADSIRIHEIKLGELQDALTVRDEALANMHNAHRSEKEAKETIGRMQPVCHAAQAVVQASNLETSAMLSSLSVRDAAIEGALAGLKDVVDAYEAACAQAANADVADPSDDLPF